MNLISRNTARDLGLARFYTGILCRRGHDSERRTSGGACVECKCENWRKWAYNHPSEYAQQRRDGYERNKDRISEYGYKWRFANANLIIRRRMVAAQKRQEEAKAALAELNLKRVSEGLHPISKRKEAMAAGEQYFYTGKGCKRNHIESPRATNTGICVECNREKAKAVYARNPEALRQWQRDNPEKIAGYKRKWRENNRGELNARQREVYARNPEKQKAASAAWRKKNRNKIAVKAQIKYQEKRRAIGFDPLRHKTRLDGSMITETPSAHDEDRTEF